MSKHETRDTNVRSVVIFGAGLLVVVVVVLFAMNRMFSFLAARKDSGPPASPLALTREIPPEPRLQLDDSANLKALQSAEEKVLASYGWVNEKEGIVRIPIERAIELLAKRGLPARSESQAPGIR